MSQSTWHPSSYSGLHVAIIMDGSGRWARAQGLARPAGQHAGVEAVRRAVEAAPQLGVTTLTLHAFSAENWLRPEREVQTLLKIFEDYLSDEVEIWLKAGVRVTVIGRRDRVPAQLRTAMAAAEAVTRHGNKLHLRLAIDYSSRESIARAAECMPRGTELPEPLFAHLLAEATGDVEAPEVDLVIRTGGEHRLSNFFLWECAYAELYFTPVLWPDFDARHFAAALENFHARDRRFGRIPEEAVVA